MSIKSSLNNPDTFDKWLRNEEIEFKEPPIQGAMEKVSISQSSSYYLKLITFYFLLYYFFPSEKVDIFIFLIKIVFWHFKNKLFITRMEMIISERNEILLANNRMN